MYVKVLVGKGQMPICSIIGQQTTLAIIRDKKSMNHENIALLILDELEDIGFTCLSFSTTDHQDAYLLHTATEKLFSTIGDKLAKIPGLTVHPNK